jgi:hypothetical protein
MARQRGRPEARVGAPSRREILTERLLALAPRIPKGDREMILDHCALARSLRALPPGSAVWLAAVAHIRHRYTDYERLLEEGYGTEAARHFTSGAIDEVLSEWGATRRVGG